VKRQSSRTNEKLKSVRLEKSPGRYLMVSLGVAIGLSTIVALELKLILQAVFRLNLIPFAILASVLFLTNSVSSIVSTLLVPMLVLPAVAVSFVALYSHWCCCMFKLLGFKKTILFFATAWSLDSSLKRWGLRPGYYVPIITTHPSFLGVVPFEVPVS